MSQTVSPSSAQASTLSTHTTELLLRYCENITVTVFKSARPTKSHLKQCAVFPPQNTIPMPTQTCSYLT